MLIQRYVQGREVNVGVLGDAVLPISEIDFGAMPKGMWRIVTYRSKWETGSDEDIGSAPTCPARLPAPVASQHVTANGTDHPRIALGRIGTGDIMSGQYHIRPDGGVVRR